MESFRFSSTGERSGFGVMAFVALDLTEVSESLKIGKSHSERLPIIMRIRLGHVDLYSVLRYKTAVKVPPRSYAWKVLLSGVYRFNRSPASYLVNVNSLSRLDGKM